jgi:hypothetical protein
MNGNRLDIQASVDLDGLKKASGLAPKTPRHSGDDGARR